MSSTSRASCATIVPSVRLLIKVPIPPRQHGALHRLLDTDRLGKSAQDVARELLDGTPRIRLWPEEDDDTLVVNAHTLNEGEEQAIADKMRELLG